MIEESGAKIKITTLWLEKGDTLREEERSLGAQRGLTGWQGGTECVSLGTQFSQCLKLDQLLGV